MVSFKGSLDVPWNNGTGKKSPGTGSDDITTGESHNSGAAVTNNPESDAYDFASHERDEQTPLPEGAELFQSAFDHAAVGMALVALDGRWLKVNTSVSETVGYSEEELLSMNFQSITHPDDIAPGLNYIGRVLTGDLGNFQIEKRYIHKNGSIVWVLLSVSVVRGAEDKPLYLITQLQDISMRKQAEAALRESEARYRMLFSSTYRKSQELTLLNQVRDALAQEMNPAVIYRTVVDAIAQVFGYDHVSIYLREGSDMVLQHQVGYDKPIERISVYSGICGRVARSGQAEFVSDVRLEPDFIQAADDISSEICVPLHDEDNVTGILNVETTYGTMLSGEDLRLLTGISNQIGIAAGRARLYNSARESEEKYRSVVDNIREVIFQTDGTGRLTFLNPAWEEITGFSREESLGRSLYYFVHPNDRAENLSLAKLIISGEIDHYRKEFRYITKGGELRWIEVFIQLQYDKEGRGIGAAGTMNDVTERKMAEQALRENEASLRALYDITSAQSGFEEKLQALLLMASQKFGMDQGVLLKSDGAQFEVIAAEPTTEQVYRGLTFELDDSWSWRTLDTDQPLAYGLGEEPCPEGFPVKSYLGMAVKLGGKPYGTLAFYNWEPRKQPFKSADKEFVRLMTQWISSEIEREQSTEQLQSYAREIAAKNSDLAEARDQAVESSRLKSEFLATMSHEIRTPMNSILGMTELLLEKNLGGEEREFATIVFDSAQSLLTIINDILDFSKIEAGKLLLDNTDFSPLTVIESAAELLAPKAQEKKLSLMTFIGLNTPAHVRGDPMRLRQILVNLISNSIKFTDRGEVTVRATPESTTNTETVIRFSVSDTGIGLSEVARKRLFQPFTQADGSTTRKYGGTGLGLAICKRLVEIMGGEMGVDSKEGAGSTFWFTARFQYSAVTEPMPPSARASLSGLKVLIIDDSAVSREITRSQIASWEVSCASASSAEEGLEMLTRAASESKPFDLALVDLCLPGMDGIALGEVIKREPAIAKTSLILLTAYDRPGQGEQALKVGFVAYLKKPVKRSHLQEAIAYGARGRLEEMSLDIAQYRLEGSMSPSRSRTTAYLSTSILSGIVLLVEDNPANQRLAVLLLERMGYTVHCAHNGREAVERVLNNDNLYDLVLMDWQMPEMDGLEATRAIRIAELHSGRHVPIIALTANAMERDREACLAAGMDDYLSKPLNRTQLRKALKRWRSDVTEDVDE